MGRAGLAAVLILGGLALAGPAPAQTRTDGQKPTTTTTSAPPPRTSQGQPTRTAPTTLPMDPGSLTGAPSTGSPTRTSPDYGPMGPTGTRTTRPRRSADPPPDTGSGDEIPYVDPPAAPGYGPAADTPVRTAGGKPVTQTHGPSAPTPPAAPSVAPATGTAAAPAAPIPPQAGPASPQPTTDAVIADQPAPPPPANPNLLWIALAGLAAMLVAAGLGLRHILAAPQLTFRVTVDHGVQSAPRFKGAAS